MDIAVVAFQQHNISVESFLSNLAELLIKTNCILFLTLYFDLLKESPFFKELLFVVVLHQKLFHFRGLGFLCLWLQQSFL